MRLFFCYFPLFLLGVVSLFFPVISQPPEYHLFAGSRFLLVASNLGFFIFGLLGMVWTLKKRVGSLWSLFFFSIILIGIGSSIYHLHPSNMTLYLDRLPMAMGFMSIIGALTYERVPGYFLPGSLLVFAIAAPTYWIVTNDLRPYLILQFFPFLTIPLLLFLFKKPLEGKRFLLYALCWMIVAKLSESKDLAIYSLTGDNLSGHSLKHIFSALAIFYVWRYLTARDSSYTNREK